MSKDIFEMLLTTSWGKVFERRSKIVDSELEAYNEVNYKKIILNIIKKIFNVKVIILIVLMLLIIFAIKYNIFNTLRNILEF